MKLKSGTMKRTLFIVITVFVLVLPIVPVTATDITDMSLTYDFDSQVLTVNVSHYTSNTKTHFVETIKIWCNGVSVHNQTYENQTNSCWEYDTFDISASAGDNLTVSAIESKDYIITRWLIVTGPTTTSTSVTDTTTTTTDTTSTTGSTTTDSTETTSTETTSGSTNPNIPDSPDTPANLGLVLGVGIFLVIFFIVLFAWLNPDKVPDAIKQLGTRIKDGLSRIWAGISNLFGQIRTKINSK